MNPPKCKTCGKAEWGHVCGALPAGESLTATSKQIEDDRPLDRQAMSGGAAGSATNPATNIKAALAVASTPAAGDPVIELGAGASRRGDGADSVQAQKGATTETTLTKRGKPRHRAPKGTFDRKAYQREKARERRAKAKPA